MFSQEISMTILKLCLYSYFVDLYFYIGDEFCIDRLCTESSVTFTFCFFLPEKVAGWNRWDEESELS